MNVPDFHPRPLATGAVWLALPALLALVHVSLDADHAVDFWLHVNTGRAIWETGTLATRDAFTCTIACQEVVNQNWLAEVATYGLYRTGGYDLCQFAAGACYAAAIGLVVRLSRLRSGDDRAAAFAGLAGLALAISNFGVRPQAISAVLFAGELYVLWRRPGRWTTAAAAALIELLWTNSHGAFALGVVLPGLFACGALAERAGTTTWRSCLADRVVRGYMTCTLAAAAMMFANPQPSRTLDYVLNTSSKSAQRGIEEWLPTSWGTFTGDAFFLSIAAMLVLLGLSRRHLKRVEALLLVAFVLLAAQAQRMVIWWALVAPPIAAPSIAVLLAALVKRRRHVAGDESSGSALPIAALLVAVVLGTLPWTRGLNPLLPESKRRPSGIDEPAGAVDFLRRSQFRGNVFAPVSWGAYLSCFLNPDVKIFADSRIESFPDEVWDDYLKIGAAAGDWQSALDRYDIECIVWCDRLSLALLEALRRSPHWREVFADERCVVFWREAAHAGTATSSFPLDSTAAARRN